MFVDEGHQRLLHDHQLVRGVVEQGIEGVPLTSHPDIVVQPGQLLRDDSVGEDALPLGDDHHVHHHVLGQPDGRPEVPGQGHQEVEDGDDVLGVDGLDTPPGLVSLEAQHSVGDSQDNPEQTQRFINNIGGKYCSVYFQSTARPVYSMWLTLNLLCHKNTAQETIIELSLYGIRATSDFISDMEWTSLVWYHYLSILLPSLYSLQFVLLSFLRLRHLGHRQPLPGEFLQQLLQDLQPQTVSQKTRSNRNIFCHKLEKLPINMQSLRVLCRKLTKHVVVRL